MKKLQLKKDVVENLNNNHKKGVNGGGWNIPTLIAWCADGPIVKPEVSHTCIKVSFYYSCDCKEHVNTVLCVAE